jgi:hypothetical protein
MSDLFFGNNATWFTVPALIGTLFFVVRLGLMLVGGGDWDVDADVDADIDGDIDGDFDDSDHAFKVLSIQSITAFMMGFGWGGLGGFKGAGWSVVNSVSSSCRGQGEGAPYRRGSRALLPGGHR